MQFLGFSTRPANSITSIAIATRGFGLIILSQAGRPRHRREIEFLRLDRVGDSRSSIAVGPGLPRIRLPRGWPSSDNGRSNLRQKGRELTHNIAKQAARGASLTMVSEQFLALLVCPMGKVPLRHEGDTLVCTQCNVRFSIKDDIPNMIVEEAELPPTCSCLADLECVKAGRAKVDIA
jgi:uncharacterized protein